jgi:hypothetical protein
VTEPRYHIDGDIVWTPLPDFAREYNKNRDTIRDWIDNGFIFTLGCTVKKDVTGHWFIGRRRNPSNTDSTVSKTSSLTA